MLPAGYEYWPPCYFEAQNIAFSMRHYLVNVVYV